MTPYTVTFTTLDGDGNTFSSYLVCQNGANGPGRAAMIADDEAGPGDRVTVDIGANVPLALDFIARATGRNAFTLSAESTMQVTFPPDMRNPQMFSALRNPKRERGQMLVIVALGLTVLIAMAGLIIDGGMALSNRRQVQNAADAASLAGPACSGST